MFDFAPTELLVIGAVAILVIPPKDLPKAMRIAGHWVGRMRGVARQFRSGFDSMIREAELQEMEKKWAAENERIMREHPPTPAQMIAMVPQPGQETVVEDAALEDAAPAMVEAPVIAPKPRAPRKPRARKPTADQAAS
jgi:sec-independent protein translocase protein TatB